MTLLFPLAAAKHGNSMLMSVSEIFSSLLFWQLLSFLALVGFGVLFFLKRNQRSKIIQFMERRTHTIIEQKEKIEEQKALIEFEHQKSDELIRDIFPDKIATVLKNKG